MFLKNVYRIYILRTSFPDITVYSGKEKWWGNDRLKKEEAEIDIVAINSDSCLLCECKWSK